MDFLLVLLPLGAAFILIYPIVVRKKITMKYEGKLKPLSSVGHLLLSIILPFFCVYGLVEMLLLIIFYHNDNKVKGVIMYLVYAIVMGILSYVYFKRHLKKLKALVPDQSAGKTFANQLLLGLGTVNYTYICCCLFVLVLFGVPLFRYSWD